MESAVNQQQQAGRSVMIVRHGSRWLGVSALADQPRPEARDALVRLREMGLRPLVMLTGDDRGVADAIGKVLGVDEVKADLLPEDKVSAIQALMRKQAASP